MRPKPEDHDTGKIEYLGTVRGTSENEGSLATLVTWLDISGLKSMNDVSDRISIQYTKACWSVKEQQHVEFDLYNTARLRRYQRVIPHRTDTDCHRQRVGVLLYALVMSGYKVDVYKNKELEGIRLRRPPDWQI
jgi:hypothetical protein